MQDIVGAIVTGLVSGLFGFLAGTWVGMLFRRRITEIAIEVWLAKLIEERAAKEVR